MSQKSVSTKESSRAPISQRRLDVKRAPSGGLIGGEVAITIDGREVKVPMGSTILDAAKQLGIRIPTLCNHEDLCVAGVCRVCVVEVEGQRTLQAACAYPVLSPMNVKTHSRTVRQARRHVIDLLLSNHCGECYTCARDRKSVV